MSDMSLTLESLRGTRPGPAYVLGSGPSLKDIPDKLYGTVIAVNGSIVKYPTADFYYSNDGRVYFRSHWKLVMESPDVMCVLAESTYGWYRTCYDNPPYLIKQQGLPEEFPIPEERLLVLPKRPAGDLTMSRSDNLLITSSSSAHSAVHLAYMLGADPIVLLGCDCCTLEGKKYFMDFPGQPQDEFSPLIQEWDNEERAIYAQRTTWDQIHNANPDVPIINASGGELSVFPRVLLEEVNKPC